MASPTLRLLALPAMAMGGSHQGTVNLKAHLAAQAAAAQRCHSAFRMGGPFQVCAIWYFEKISSTRLNAFSAEACGVALT